MTVSYALERADCSWHIRLAAREDLGRIGWGKDDPVQCLATAEKFSVFSASFLLEQTPKTAPDICPLPSVVSGYQRGTCRCARRGVFGPAARTAALGTGLSGPTQDTSLGTPA